MRRETTRRGLDASIARPNFANLAFANPNVSLISRLDKSFQDGRLVLPNILARSWPYRSQDFPAKQRPLAVKEWS